MRRRSVSHASTSARVRRVWPRLALPLRCVILRRAPPTSRSRLAPARYPRPMHATSTASPATRVSEDSQQSRAIARTPPQSNHSASEFPVCRRDNPKAQTRRAMDQRGQAHRATRNRGSLRMAPYRARHPRCAPKSMTSRVRTSLPRVRYVAWTSPSSLRTPTRKCTRRR